MSACHFYLRDSSLHFNNPAPTLVVGCWTFVDVSAPYSCSSSLQLISPDACRRCWFTVRPSVVVAVCVCCHISANTAFQHYNGTSLILIAGRCICSAPTIVAGAVSSARPSVVVAVYLSIQFVYIVALGEGFATCLLNIVGDNINERRNGVQDNAWFCIDESSAL